MINMNMPKVATIETPKQGGQVVSPAKSAKPDIVDTAESVESVTTYQDIKAAEQAVPAGQQQAKEIDEAELSQAVKQINDFVQDIQRNIEFSVDDDTGRTVIRVYDSSTEELIRQIPNEEVLELAKNLKQNNGLLFNAKA
mgnify:CR=1 FL=1